MAVMMMMVVVVVCPCAIKLLFAISIHGANFDGDVFHLYLLRTLTRVTLLIRQAEKGSFSSAVDEILIGSYGRE